MRLRLFFGARLWILASFPIVLFTVAACGWSAQAARDFEVTQFDGARFRLSEQIGTHAVVLNFWYPSCPPCREEMPAFQQAWEDLQGEPVRFLGLFVPQGFDSEQDARDFADELGLTFSFATDRLAKIADAYQLEAFPTTYFIDTDGKIAATHISRMKADEITRLVRGLTSDRPY